MALHHATRAASRRLYSTARTTARTHRLKTAAAGVAATTIAVLAYQLNQPARVLHADAAPVKSTKDTQWDYSQQKQVTMSWEHPGVYLWGSNKARVTDTKSAEPFTKTPTRLTAFDGMALRDLKVSENVGVAVLDSGDVMMWGQGFTGDVGAPANLGRRKKGAEPAAVPQPELTLVGKDVAKVEISNEMVYALTKQGAVYGIPIQKQAQQAGPKLQESSWFGLSSSTAKISYSKVTASDQASFSDIAAGANHLLLLSKTGNVYACASSSKGNMRGQMGQRDWQFSAQDNALEALRIQGFNNAKATAIAAGEQHSVVLAGDEVYTFGANTYGQLAFNFNAESTDVVNPTSVMVNALYPRNLQAKCLSIAAGGRNTYMVVQSEEPGLPSSRRVDIWCSGTSQFGQLGNNTWNHYQSKPVKVKQISGLTEWDEVNNCVLPIGIYKLSVGSSHVICVLDNVAKVDADPSASRKAFDTINYGKDCLCWGSSSDYQLGSGKRASAPLPIYISPLEASAEKLALKSGWEEVVDEGHKRFHLTPPKVIEVQLASGKRAKRNVEQMVVAGHLTSACYSKLVE